MCEKNYTIYTSFDGINNQTSRNLINFKLIKYFRNTGIFRVLILLLKYFKFLSHILLVLVNKNMYLILLFYNLLILIVSTIMINKYIDTNIFDYITILTDIQNKWKTGGEAWNVINSIKITNLHIKLWF